jgi:hypothetical protein
VRSVAILLVIGVLTQPSAHAQVLDDWIMLHSDSSFDYLVTERGIGVLDSAGAVRRVTVSRMLVRHADDARTRIVAEREAAGAQTAGYASYISSTYILNVGCDSRTVALVETTDFDTDGRVLSRNRVDPVHGRRVAGWEARAADRLVQWTCARSASPGRGIDNDYSMRGRENGRPSIDADGLANGI